MRSVVVLPAPFGPSRPKISPAATVRSMPLTASTVRPAARNDLRSPVTLTAGIGGEDMRGTPSVEVAGFFELVGGWPVERAVPQLLDDGPHPGEFRLPHGLRVLVLDPEDPRERSE